MSRRYPVPKPDAILADGGVEILDVMEKSAKEAMNTQRYLSWQDLRRLYQHGPDGLSLEQWWLGIKLHRRQARMKLPLCDARGRCFTLASTGMIQMLLREVDLKAGGNVAAPSSRNFWGDEQKRYLINSLVEESVMSSMLEGAAVTRSEARKMLKSNRAPVGVDERMILNNYLTMQMIVDRQSEALTPDFILALHRSLVEGTFEDVSKVGRLRCEDDRVRVEDDRSGELVHTPPPAGELRERLEALCRFANEEYEGDYIHPVIRAIALHFQLAYDHPFVDGNGRTARALFYWAMLRHGYWVFEYISISHEIFNHAARYFEAFLNSEEDENDLNYFIINQLDAICKSVDALMAQVRRKQGEHEALCSRLRESLDLNHRQKDVLVGFLKHPDVSVTVAAHARQHMVSKQTARADMMQLVEMGYLISRRQSRTDVFSPAPHFLDQLSR